MIEFKMPALGSDMDEGTLDEWLVKPGDPVTKGQVVAVVETTKPRSRPVRGAQNRPGHPRPSSQKGRRRIGRLQPRGPNSAPTIVAGYHLPHGASRRPLPSTSKM
jgi:hypothetical protein